MNAMKVSGLVLGMLLAACGGDITAGASECRVECDGVRNTCTQRCTAEACRTTCSQQADQCRVTCDNPMVSTRDAGTVSR